jgi:voltage-gated potassium channel Kch
MKVAAVILGILCFFVVAFDGFETIILPRRVVRRVRLAKIFYRVSWAGWAALARKMRPGNRREYYLSFYGPLSLIMLLVLWAALFILAFALVQWGASDPMQVPEKVLSFGSYLYMSGTTFVTLGFGDITPLSGLGRFLAVLEGGTGLGFLALVIGYVPVIYQTFSRREVNISLLDARSGTPPSGPELLIRHYNGQSPDELIQHLREWERWCAELLESHLSYPVLAYYRSQHESQSWLTALTALLDTCALILVGIEGMPLKPAKFIFAMARHAAVDLTQSFGLSPVRARRKYQPDDFTRLCTELAARGITLRDDEEAGQRLKDLRATYEPFVEALADYLLVDLPELQIIPDRVDDWQTSAWDHFLVSSPRTLDRAMRRG